MKDDQGNAIVNPETIKIIRNLRQKGSLEKQDRDYYINLMLECLRLRFGDKKTPMALIEEHGQEWCMTHGIIGYDYIVNASFTSARDTGKRNDSPGIADDEFQGDIYS